MDQVQLIRAPLGKSIACIAFETWARMNAKPRNPEVKVLLVKPSKATPITKFEDCDTNLQNHITRFLKSRHTVKEFASTLGKKARELSEEEKTVRENLVNHLMNVENHAETVEMELPKRLVEKKKVKKDKNGKNEKDEKDDNEKNGKNERKGTVDADNDDADTIDDFDDAAFPELHDGEKDRGRESLSASNSNSSSSSAVGIGKNLFDEFQEEEEKEEEEDSDNETVNSKFNVAIEARKRNVSKITCKEFKAIFELITNEILKDNFRLNPESPYEETILRTCLSSDLFWSNLFTRINQVLEKEQSQKMDDKLVLYIRNQKK